MREIKFRAWDSKEKEMFFPETENNSDTFFTGFNSGVVECQDGECNNYPVMQFTGLKDKNGKEIYEGDIVETISHFNSKVIDRKYKIGDKVKYGDKEVEVFEIVADDRPEYSYQEFSRFYTGSFEKVEYNIEYGFIPFADSPDNCGHCGGGRKSSGVRVVGNIYENPDLLLPNPLA